jgi:hypothetical protein
VVDDRDEDDVTFGLGVHPDRRAGGRELRRVRQEVRHHVGEGVGIGEDRDTGGNVHLHRVLDQRRREVLEYIRNFLGQLDPLARHSYVVGVETGEVEELADETVELVGVGGRAIEELTPAMIGKRRPVLQHRVDKTLHGRERRAQFV